MAFDPYSSNFHVCFSCMQTCSLTHNHHLRVANLSEGHGITSDKLRKVEKCLGEERFHNLMVDNMTCLTKLCDRVRQLNS